MVVLEVLFPYGFKYEMGPPMSEKLVKESQSEKGRDSLIVSVPLLDNVVTCLNVNVCALTC